MLSQLPFQFAQSSGIPTEEIVPSSFAFSSIVSRETEVRSTDSDAGFDPQALSRQVDITPRTSNVLTNFFFIIILRNFDFVLAHVGYFINRM